MNARGFEIRNIDALNIKAYASFKYRGYLVHMNTMTPDAPVSVTVPAGKHEDAFTAESVEDAILKIDNLL